MISHITLRRSIRLKNSQSRVLHHSVGKKPDYKIDLLTGNKSKRNSSTRQPQTLSGIDGLISYSKKEQNLDETSSNVARLEDSINYKFEKIEDVLKVISKDHTPNSGLIEELNSTVKLKEKTLRGDDLKELLNGTINLEVRSKDLEDYLRTIKHNKDLQDEEHFREERAFQSSLPRFRTLEKKNFFTPIDENLIRSVKRGTHPSFTLKEDDLFFPTIPNTDNNIHEFMILQSGQKIISETNPLGPYYHRPDLVTLMKSLDSQHDKYWNLVLKYEREKWKLIAIDGYDENKVLIFERNIPLDELKKLTMYKWLRICYGVGIIGALFYALGYYYEMESLKQKKNNEITNLHAFERHKIN